MAKKKTKAKTRPKPRKKSATLSLRLTPEIKAVASRLASGGRRSLNGLVEFLIKKEAERIEKKTRPRGKRKK